MIPSWLQAVVLGIVQGLTEFIPVSSSGHLVLVPYLSGWERPGLAFDVALHLGTAGAIILYFRGELFAMARGVLSGGDTPDGRLYRRLALFFVIASVPIGIVGLTLHDLFEEAFATPPVAAALLFLTATILFSGERWRARRVRLAGAAGVVAGGAGAARGSSEGAARRGGEAPGAARGSGEGMARRGGEAQGAAHGSGEGATRRGGAAADGAGDGTAPGVYTLELGDDPADPAGCRLDQVTLRQALLIGLAQCLALFPGVSRSGTTIMAGVAAGLTRQAATRFSFLLALPALVGAGILSLPDLAEPDVYTGWEIAGGVLASFVASYLAIRFLVAFVSRQKLDVFAAYCVVAGSIGLGVWLLAG